MRTAVTLAKKHTGGWDLLASPDVPLIKQNEIYRSFLLTKSHEDYCYVQIQESDGLFRRTFLRTPDEHKEHQAQLTKQNEEARIAGDKEITDKEKKRREQDELRAKRHQEELDALNNENVNSPNRTGAKAAPATQAEGDNGKAPAPATPTAPKAGGPTMEDWTDAGYNPASYPPDGFAEVDTPALKEYKETGKVSPREPFVTPIIPAAGSTTEAAAKAESAANESQPKAEAAEGEKSPTAQATQAEGDTK